jgi:hypothetical protein
MQRVCQRFFIDDITCDLVSDGEVSLNLLKNEVVGKFDLGEGKKTAQEFPWISQQT